MFKLFSLSLFTFILFWVSPSYSLETYPVQGSIKPNDDLLYKPIPISSGNQLTIVSWNIRNLGAYNRSIKDYSAMVNIIDEADIVVLQEVGLGLLRTETITEAQKITLESVRSLWEIQLGDEWTVTLADQGSGSGAGKETSMVAYRNSVNGKTIDATFKGYHELGDNRDMPLWDFKLGKETTLSIGSMHLTPHDPERGSEMINMLSWLQSMNGNYAIAMGDMNYGYQKTSRVENYIGENKLIELDNSKKIYQVFRNLSYLGKGDKNALRTNLGFRSGAYFYDQFLLTPSLSDKLSFGGELLKDVGMLAFGVHDKYMNYVISKNEKKRSYALIKYESESSSINQDNYDKAIKKSQAQAANDATWSISDHRPIWIKLDIL